MKKKSRFLSGIIIALLAVAVILLVVSTVFSATTAFHQIPVTVQIIPAVPDVKLCSSTAGTPLNGIQFASLHQGETSGAVTVYAVNRGIQPQACSVAIVEGNTQSWGTVTLSVTNLGTIQPGANASFTITVSANVNATVGQYTINLLLYQTGTLTVKK